MATTIIVCIFNHFLRHIRPPDTAFNFPENWNSPIVRETEALKQAFFNETNPTKKQELRTRIDEKIQTRYQHSQKTFGYEVTFDFRTVFSEVFQAV